MLATNHVQIDFVSFLPSLGEHLFDHHLWSLFQSSLHTLQITFFFMFYQSSQFIDPHYDGRKPLKDSLHDAKQQEKRGQHKQNHSWESGSRTVKFVTLILENKQCNSNSLLCLLSDYAKSLYKDTSPITGYLLESRVSILTFKFK